MSMLKVLVCAGDSVADIGANLGVYTRDLSFLVDPNGLVYSYEPINENYQILESVVRKARLSNVRPCQAAVGLRVGEQQMVVPDLGDFTGYYQAHFSKEGDRGRFEQVKVLSLDELWKSGTIPRLDFVKCDVEGAELEVVEGGLMLIEAQLPGWVMEVSKAASDAVFAVFRNLGYRAFFYRDGLVQTECYLDKQFSNYFFLHPQSKVWERALPHLRLEVHE